MAIKEDFSPLRWSPSAAVMMISMQILADYIRIVGTSVA